MLRFKVTVLSALCVFLCVAVPTAYCGDYKGKIECSLDDLKFEKCAGFDKILYKEAIYTAVPGAPALPLIRVNVAIPTDATVQGVTVLSVDSMEIAGLYDVMPVTEPIKMTGAPPDNAFFKDPGIYNRDAYYPGIDAEVISTWDKVGQDFVTLSFYPVQYNPMAQRLTLATRIDFEVTYEESEDPVHETYNLSEKNRSYCLEKLKSAAINPEDVNDLPAYVPDTSLGRALSPGDYEYVIITTSSFEPYFQALADWRTQMGMPAKIVTTTWIYANYNATYNYGKIKNFVQDAHSTWGTMFFLLGGDTSYVPHHTRYVMGYNVANDTYYSDYDGDWICEVYVGRACVNGSSQATTFVDKVLTYEKNPPIYGRKLFFMGFDLDNYTDAEDCKIFIDNNYLDSYANLYTEYDSEGGGHESDVKAYINSGKNLINHADHGEVDLVGVGLTNHGTYLSSSEAQAFTNGTMYCNFVTLSCLSGSYHQSCWGEHLVRDDHGGITFVGNSSYGLYYQGNTNGLSFLYDQKWWQVLYQNNAYRAGETLACALNKVYPGDATHKYLFTEWNLLGDPGLHFWTRNPLVIDVTYDSQINTGSQSYQVNVKREGLNYEGALVCAMKGDEVYDYSVTGPLGIVTLSIDPTTSGTMTLTVTGKNCGHFEGQVTVSSTQPPPTISSIVPCYGLDTGGTSVTITGTNFTTTPAMSVKIAGIDCTNINVQNSTTLTCTTPAGPAGRRSIQVSNSYGTGTLVEGYLYFSVGGLPFNTTDVLTESIDAPKTITLIVTGLPYNTYAVYYSYGGGPIQTGWGTMGLGIPFWLLFMAPLNSQGYSLVPLALPSGYGPFDFYMHTLGLDSQGKILWAEGGNNPNGSGSVYFHLNN